MQVPVRGGRAGSYRNCQRVLCRQIDVKKERLTPPPGAVTANIAQAVGNASGPTYATEITSRDAP